MYSINKQLTQSGNSNAQLCVRESQETIKMADIFKIKNGSEGTAFIILKLLSFQAPKHCDWKGSWTRCSRYPPLSTWSTYRNLREITRSMSVSKGKLHTTVSIEFLKWPFTICPIDGNVYLDAFMQIASLPLGTLKIAPNEKGTFENFLLLFRVQSPKSRSCDQGPS